MPGLNEDEGLQPQTFKLCEAKELVKDICFCDSIIVVFRTLSVPLILNT